MRRRKRAANIGRECIIAATMQTGGPPTRHLGFGTGVGLVVSSMVGAGVFLSTGYMAQDMGPGLILSSWVLGGVIALSGALAYAGIAHVVTRSGGEYRFLSELAHPALGYLAGWASLLFGFAGPVAICALAAGGFILRLVPLQSARPGHIAACLIVVLTAVHASRLGPSRRVQNALVALNVVLLLGFVAIGLIWGSHSWPTWVPPRTAPGFPAQPFAVGLLYIAYAFTGWNAAIYAADEFRRPERDIPRAMLFGCVAIGILYLAVNWVLVANITPEGARAVFSYETERVTLGHVVMRGLIGEGGARVMSALIALVLIGTVSAMLFAGPRTYVAMAQDGFLPRLFTGRAGQPPRGAVVLQGLLALAIVSTQSLQGIMQGVGALLTLMSALTALCLFRAVRRAGIPRWLRWVGLPAAAFFALCAAGMLYVGVVAGGQRLGTTAVFALAVLAAYLVTRGLARRG
jgi:APA family basic amino acid/polyamine antiporter